MSRRASVADTLDHEAELVERLAVLLAAGVSAAAAWRHLAAEEPGGLAGAVAGEGSGLTDRLVAAAADQSGAGARSLAAVWRVATAAGAPLAVTLSALADTLRDLAEGARERETALAGPRATSRIVLALPPLGLLLGLLLGLDSGRVLLGTPVGWGCLVVGALLVFTAQRWTGRMLRRAAVGPPAPGLALELVAVGLAGGMPPDRARGLAAEALRATGLADTTGAALRHLDFSRAAGVPAGGLLRHAARAERRAARAVAARNAADLGTRLVLPLGLCVLPAFVLLGVVPAGIAIVSTAGLLG